MIWRIGRRSAPPLSTPQAMSTPETTPALLPAWLAAGAAAARVAGRVGPKGLAAVAVKASMWSAGRR